MTNTDTKTTIASLTERLTFAGLSREAAEALGENPSAREAGFALGAERARVAAVHNAIEGEALRVLTDEDYLSEYDSSILALAMVAIGADEYDHEGWQAFVEGWNSVAAR